MSMFGKVLAMMNDFDEMKQKARAAKEEIFQSQFEGVSEDGNVIAVVRGDCTVLSIEFKSPNTNQTAILEAINNGLDQAKKSIADKISDVTGGLPEEFL